MPLVMRLQKCVAVNIVHGIVKMIFFILGRMSISSATSKRILHGWVALVTTKKCVLQSTKQKMIGTFSLTNYN